MGLCEKRVLTRIAAALAAAVMTVCLFLLFPVKANADTPYLVSLDDFDECLTYYEETELRTEMLKAANKIKCNIGIVITADLQSRTSQRYADLYLDNAFGVNSDSIVLVLLNKHDNPKYSSQSLYRDWISTSGRARDLYDKHIDSIFDRAYRGLDNEFSGSEPEHIEDVYEFTDSIQFFMTGKYFCKALVSYKNPVSRFFSNAFELFKSNFILALGAVGVPILITVLVVSSVASKYHVKKPISASEYIDRSHFIVKREVDQFVNEYTTSVTISSSSGGRSGGGGGGGGSHGGGGGRSR